MNERIIRMEYRLPGNQWICIWSWEMCQQWHYCLHCPSSHHLVHIGLCGGAQIVLSSLIECVSYVNMRTLPKVLWAATGQDHKVSLQDS